MNPLDHTQRCDDFDIDVRLADHADSRGSNAFRMTQITCVECTGGKFTCTC